MLRNFPKNEVSRQCPRFLLILFTLFVWTAADVRAAEIYVGPTRTLKTLQAGVAAARANDHVILDAGVYVDDVVSVDRPMTIEGAGRGATLRITKPIPNRKGILVVNADLTIRKITFEGAFVTDEDGKNGAGIRHQAGRLTVDTCVFNNNQNGILANANPDATVTIRRSSFSGNGAGDGYSHGIYINAVAHLRVSDSTFAGTKVGHNIKSRALKTTITDTVLDDGITGSASYAVDLPNGGEVVLKGLKVTQGQRTSNSSMIAFGAEKSLHENSSLTITDSTFVNRAQNSTGIYNFTGITATLRDNSFQNVGEVTKGPVRLNKVTLPAVKEGVVFSGADSNARSYLRFHNTGTVQGSVTVRLYDGRDGRYLGAWQSPSIPPNAAPQYSITTLEAAIGAGTLPPTYSVSVETSMTGTFQHVLHRPDHGVLTNLSSCTTGTTRAGPQIAGIHTSKLDDGYPASIFIQNFGATPARADIGIYDARQGTRMGSYSSPEVPVDGEVVIPVALIEATAHVVPAWDMSHWVLKIENDFAGALQSMIINRAAGLITDMTAVCDLNGASAGRSAAPILGPIFPTSAALESMLQVHNTGQIAAPFRVTIYESASGARVGHWDGPPLASHASRKYGLSSILEAAGAKSGFYRVSVESEFPGYVQHMLRHGADTGVSINLTTCDAGPRASLRDAVSLRASVNEGEDVALLVVYNSGSVPAAAALHVFDAFDGRALGTFTTEVMPAGGTLTLTVVDIEANLGIPPNGGPGAFNVRLDDDFGGSMQQLAVSTRTGAVTDMTAVCAIGPDAG
jgi:hypothetical protein